MIYCAYKLAPFILCLTGSILSTLIIIFQSLDTGAVAWFAADAADVLLPRHVDLVDKIQRHPSFGVCVCAHLPSSRTYNRGRSEMGFSDLC